MAKITVPYSLPVSTFIRNITAMNAFIANQNTTLHIDELLTTLFDETKIESTEFGNGIIYNFRVDLPVDEALTRTSSLTADPVTGNYNQEVITINKYRKVTLSSSATLNRDTNNTVSNVIEWLKQGIQERKDFSLYNYTVETIKNSNLVKSPRATQKVNVPWIDVSALTDYREQCAAEIVNQKTLARIAKKVMIQMRKIDSKFSNFATYNDDNTKTDKPLLTSARAENLRFWIDSDVLIDAETGGSVVAYNPDAISISTLLGVKQTTLIHDDFADIANFIGILAWDKKFASSIFYNMAYGFFDITNLFEKNVLHYAFGQDEFQTPPGVVFYKTPVVRKVAQQLIDAELENQKK